VTLILKTTLSNGYGLGLTTLMKMEKARSLGDFGRMSNDEDESAATITKKKKRVVLSDGTVRYVKEREKEGGDRR